MRAQAKAFTIFLPILAILLVAANFGLADEDKDLIQIFHPEAEDIPHSEYLINSVNRFESSGIHIPVPVYVKKSENVNAWIDLEKIVFLSGLLDFVEGEGEVAYVLGHELSHRTGKHITKQILSVVGMSLLNIALSDDYEYIPSQEEEFEKAQVAQNLTVGILILSYGRTHEYGADRTGIHYMVQAGYDPNHAIAFQERLLEKSGDGSGIFTDLLSTHPTSPKRIQQIRNLIAREYEQDASGHWRRRAEPIPGERRNVASRRVKRGLQMGLITGGVSFLAATWEQSELLGDGVVTVSQKRHNVRVAVRNGVILGFLTGAILIVDVPGSAPPSLLQDSSSEPIALRYNLERDRWEIFKTISF